ncbi:type 1 glutamine amidotransferase domain-containing protein [Candidatus Nitrotoga sp. M5]|uniref:type 1 glutamine amidotransferase domain-containing protein n=1 Tax=Candidatus Nitrotoga sp. M5 TaxID=2890409 RepID=UPI001EF25703|nr:type 1 glutamine amidotransferase domain-containing protein [Candidatus Nitrotoga sp. M5]CAH1385261.1 Protein/nucleic acid deglycase HchA [Candidatus Nitrotoga sp. M5]
MITTFSRRTQLLLGAAVLCTLAFTIITRAAAEPPPTILVIISSKSTLKLQDGKTYPTGYYLNELTVPVRKLIDREYEVVFANPAGNAVAMDKRSDSADHFGNDRGVYESYRKFHDGLTGLKRPEKLSALIEKGLDRYAAVFFPGGHAPMVDLIQDADVAIVLNHFHRAGKPTAFICHGPIALVSTVKDPKAFVLALEKGLMQEASQLASGWPYAGYKMTIFSTAEEQVAEATGLGGKVRFYPDAALIAAGGKVELAKPWSPHVVKDRELITGQNPGSVGLFSEALVNAVEANRSKYNR